MSVTATSHDILKSIDDSILPPEDTLSEAMYNNVKLDHYFNKLPKSSEENNINDQTNQLIVSAAPELEDSPAAEWKLLRTLAGAHQGWIRAIALDEITNKWYVTGLADSTIKIWDFENNSLKAVLTGHVLGIRSLCISKRHPYLFSGVKINLCDAGIWKEVILTRGVKYGHITDTWEVFILLACTLS